MWHAGIQPFEAGNTASLKEWDCRDILFAADEWLREYERFRVSECRRLAWSPRLPP